ncbi:MAG: hypothetical protein ACSLE6_09695 [Mycobacterium sp.]
MGIATAVSSTVSAAAGGVGGLFDGDGTVRTGELILDEDADLPGRTSLLKPGRRVDALVRVAPLTDASAIRTVCIKLPDLYGSGCDQDFLLASSADGVPFHHATLPAAQVGDRLYSSLWLYIAGVQPVLFGVRAVGPHSFDFLLAGVLSRFARIGTLTLGAPPNTDPAMSFSAANSGGGIRALPPAAFYRG